jgi:diguanylate cyclase (GGDEF)-like protein
VDATAAETVDDRVASITQIRERCPSSEIVVLISHQTESRLADLLQAGAWYYLGVPVSKSRLALILLRVVAFRETDKLIRVDGLTGLFNRAFFDDALRDQIARIRESGGGKRTANNPPVSLVLADVDRLEHSFGDNFTAREMFLREIGQILRDTYRVTDVIARIGGDEFAALLVGVSYSLALMRAEIIRKRLSTVKPSDPAIAVPTISVGVVTYPSFFDDARDILARARTALDAAKAAGGNVVFGFDREGTPRPFRELGG